MSSLAFLVTELQSLASETRRKHPEVREAAEKSLNILRASPEQATVNLATDGPQSDDLLRPVFMGCATKNAKVVAISLGSLQRLIALKAVPQSVVPLIITTMSDSVSQGVDIQLRILQTLLSLITNFPAVHGALLGDALLLCFKLQDSRIAVVSSTAAATLRQLVMFVVDKVVDEDRAEPVDGMQPLTKIELPDGSSAELRPSARDAFSVFEDLCLLANSEQPKFLKLESLHKTFALELIESVLTNYHDLFRQHSELLLLLQHHLCPLLLKSLSERPIFPLTLRSTRVVFLLLKQFSNELPTEAEVFLMLLIKVVSGENDGDSASSHAPRPPWMRVIAMEIIRGLCSDGDLMRGVWQRYDSQSAGSNVFAALITALKRLATEKPALLGIGAQIMGIGVTPSYSSDGSSGYGTAVAGMVVNAASATVSGMVGMMASEASLSVGGSSMKLQCIDQLDKADSPPIPEPYIYLLALQCLVSLSEGFASLVLPLYNSIAIVRPRAAGEAVIRAPRALDLVALPADDPGTVQLRTVHDMLESGWPALLASLSFYISTNLSDELFADVLGALQSLINVSGVLQLTTPRDAFLTSVSKLAVPSRVVSSLDSFQEPQTPKSAVLSVENLGLSSLAGGQGSQPGLSERNLACLKALISSALFLAGSLGPSWFDVLEALQNADYVLTKGVIFPARKASIPPLAQPGTGSIPQAAPSRHPALADLDVAAIQNAIQRLFDSTKSLEDDSFRDFVAALCKLSAEMVGMQAVAEQDNLDVASTEDSAGHKLSPRATYAHRRRASGIALPRTMRTGDFGINKLGTVSLLNIHRLIYHDPGVAWNAVTTHLLAVVRHPLAPQSIRLQAARTLDEILVIVPRNLSSAGELQGQIQARVLNVLSQQVSVGTLVDIRRMGLETLHQILQSSAHTFVTGWETIFEMLGSVCKQTSTPATMSLPSDSGISTPSEPATPRGRPTSLIIGDKPGNIVLIRIAFQSLTLVCDTLSSLSPDHLRLCISTLGLFGKQTDTNIALTAAESLMWGVSDSIQSKRKDVEQEPEFSALWMFLLLELLGLCTDARHEVRVGAIQTLFRSLQLYGATLSLETWDECIWKVTFPLLDSITASIRHAGPESPTAANTTAALLGSGQSWDESKTLALQSLSAIFSDFLTLKIIRLSSFTEAWQTFVSHVEDSFLFDSRVVSTAALRCLERALEASKGSTADVDLKGTVSNASEKVWAACDEMGIKLSKSTAAASLHSPRSGSSIYGLGGLWIAPFSQDSLLAFVDVMKKTREVSKASATLREEANGEHEWPLDRLSRLMAILKGVITYSNSPEYRPDIDSLTPVQAAVMSTISTIFLEVPYSPSLVLSDLSSYATLPFLAAFEVQDQPSQTSSATAAEPRTQRQAPKRVTYIALAKKTMPMLVDLYLKYKDSMDIYVDGTVEAILSAYSIPIKLKYDCPPASKFGKDPPLWKTATECFLRIVKECAGNVQPFGDGIPNERVEGIWHQVLDVFKGGLLADCTAALSFPLAEQEAEENFDLSLLATLEIDAIPSLGSDSRIPDRLVVGLGKCLERASLITEDAGLDFRDFESSQQHVDEQSASRYEGNGHMQGTTQQSPLVPRERFSYWCLDLLFLVCSNVARDKEPARRRVAALCLPALLNRCGRVLANYVADCKLRGNVPFPRYAEEELLYVLRKLLEMRLWSGTLWASFQSRPSEVAVEQPPLDPSLSPSQLIPTAIQRSTIAHLFHFYPLLCEIAALPTKPPSAWVIPSMNNVDETTTMQELPVTTKSTQKDDHPPSSNVDISLGGKVEAVEVDSRGLSRECLIAIGRELGSQG